MASTDSCNLCNQKFVYQVKRKRLDRTCIESKLHRQNDTAMDVLEHIVNITPQNSKTYICSSCSTKVAKFGQLLHSRDELKLAADESAYLGRKILTFCSPRTPTHANKKRPCVRKTPSVKLKPSRKFVKSHKLLPDFKRTATIYLCASRYLSLFRTLVKHSKAARTAFRELVSVEIKREVTELCKPKNNSVWRQGSKDGINVFKEFSWNNAVFETERYCPLLIKTLSSALTNSSDLNRKFGKAQISLLPNLGSLVGQIVFARKPTTMKLVQEIVGLQLWMSGTSRKAFTRLNHLGITLGTDAVRAAVDRIRKGFSEDLLRAKDRLTQSNRLQARRRLFDEDAEVEDGEGFAPLDDTLPYFEGSDDDAFDERNDNDMDPLNDSIPFENEDIDPNEDDVHADDHHEAGLISPEERSDVLDNYDEPEMPDNGADQCSYSLVFDNVNKHLFAKQTSRDKGNTMKNMVQAYSAIDRIPSMQLDDRQPTPEEVTNIPCTVFLPNDDDVKAIRSDYVNQVKEVLTEHISCFQTLKLEETKDNIYEQQSARRSTLIPLGVLDKDEAKIADMVDIMESYHQYVPGAREDHPIIIPLFGDGLSVERGYDAQDARINADDPWEQLQGLHPCIQEWHKRGILLQDTFKLLYSQKSARSVGSLSYIRNSYRQINVREKVSDCFNEATDLLRFSTTAYILASALTIMKCATLAETPCDVPSEEEDLNQYMAKVAEEVVDQCFHPPNTSSILNANTSLRDVYKYCICKTETDEDMIMCDNKKCDRGKWFHLSCKDISETDILSEEWYCCRQCKTSKTSSEVEDDLVYDYSQLLLWRGIGEMVRHKAIRSNNGLKMIGYWKEDMVEFFKMGHTKYFLCGHRLLMDTHGALSSRLGHQITWNRTVNIKGGANHNIEMDLQMEFFNKELKESLKDAGGNISETTMARHGEMVGVGKELGKIMDRLCSSNTEFCRKRSEIKRQDDIEHLVNVLLKKGKNYFSQISYRLWRLHL